MDSTRQGLDDEPQKESSAPSNEAILDPLRQDAGSPLGQEAPETVDDEDDVFMYPSEGALCKSRGAAVAY